MLSKNTGTSKQHYKANVFLQALTAKKIMLIFYPFEWVTKRVAKTKLTKVFLHIAVCRTTHNRQIWAYYWLLVTQDSGPTLYLKEIFWDIWNSLLKIQLFGMEEQFLENWEKKAYFVIWSLWDVIWLRLYASFQYYLIFFYFLLPQFWTPVLDPYGPIWTHLDLFVQFGPI